MAHLPIAFICSTKRLIFICISVYQWNGELWTVRMIIFELRVKVLTDAILVAIDPLSVCFTSQCLFNYICPRHSPYIQKETKECLVWFGFTPLGQPNVSSILSMILVPLYLGQEYTALLSNSSSNLGWCERTQLSREQSCHSVYHFHYFVGRCKWGGKSLATYSLIALGTFTMTHMASS